MKKSDFVKELSAFEKDLNVKLTKNESQALKNIQKTIESYQSNQELPEHIIFNFKKMKTQICQAAQRAQPVYGYVGGVTFDAFQKSGRLVKITQTDRDQYLYFDPHFIRDFDKFNDIEQEKFKTLAQADNAKIHEKQGIKFFTPNVKCSINIKSAGVTQAFSGELKIQGSDERIGIITLASTNGGPEIIVATQRFSKGLHSKEHNGKTFQANTLDPLPRASLANTRHGFFAPPAPAKNQGKENHQSNLGCRQQAARG